jgi:predicted alpha/beta superfamily hydrolase
MSLGTFRVAGPYRVDPFPRPRYVRLYIPARGGEPRPILVLFDGQNVFGDEGSFAGGWHAHEAVEKLARSRPAPIIVGIDHGGETRAEELVPFETPGIHGRADIFLEWIVRDILPMVRGDYSTIAGPAGVLVGGSSLGGLAALYAHHRRPDIVGGALAMSPSLWVGRGALLSYVEREPRPWTSKIYLDTGAGEGGGRMSGSVQRLEKIFEARGYGKDKLLVRIDKRGAHNERSWRRRLPAALRFFYLPSR